MKSILRWILLFISGQATAQAELKTVAYVDLQRYLGTWYDIASFPQRFQKGCTCTTAEYSLHKNGTIAVVNRCIRNGKEKKATAKARVSDKKSNAKLSVQFFWPFKGKYWIIDLAEDYSYAVVGHPSRNYLWILSRSPRLPGATYDGILSRLKAQGYDLSRLRKTEQTCTH